ncbi:glycosyltransferase [Carboxylicivirga marina]|uniref:glycosyltransferase n=1 Tax=Carboxylicivirga marina TaxID=2800988 RepID=UPI00259702D7|nr:glycosyltransferase [uncultured Carboxylicivirga sp.]
MIRNVNKKDLILSIIIPVFNVERYVAKCINSLTSQISEKDMIEIIIIDDGSTDDSLSVIKNMKLPAYIKLIHTENNGVGVARNIGIDNSSGEYIWFIDSDDFVEDNFMPKALSKLKKNEYDVLAFSFQCCDEKWNIIPCRQNKVSFSGEQSGSAYYLETYKESYLWMHIFKSQVIKDNGLYFKPILFMQDSEFMPRVLCCSKRVGYLDEIGINYVKRSGSVTNVNAYSLNKVEAIIDVYYNIKLFKGQQKGNVEMNLALQKKLSVIRLILFSLLVNGSFSSIEDKRIIYLMKKNGIIPFGILYNGVKPRHFFYNTLSLLMFFSPNVIVKGYRRLKNLIK